MRARYPDTEGFVERGGVRLGYEVFGQGEPTILLLPTWTIVHSRFWKMQVHYLARRHRVITYDGPGNGRSDRVTDPDRYAADEYAADAVAVLDECRAQDAVLVGLSLGALYALRVAALHPERARAAVLVGPALPMGPPAPGREQIPELFDQPYPENPTGWEKCNAAYWRDHYEDFATFFFGEVFSEPHSTKAREDSVGWALETTPEVLLAEAGSRQPLSCAELFEGVRCPTLVVHGTEDRIHPYSTGVEAARFSGGELLPMAGSGHIPTVRDPVRFNLALRDFIAGLPT